MFADSDSVLRVLCEVRCFNAIDAPFGADDMNAAVIGCGDAANDKITKMDFMITIKLFLFLPIRFESLVSLIYLSMPRNYLKLQQGNDSIKGTISL